MFCRKCGKQLEGDSTICQECEAQSAVQPDYEVQQPAEPTVEEILDTTQPNEEPVADFTLGTVEQEAPKKNKGKYIALIVAGVVAALALVLVLCWDSVSAVYRRNFGTPEDYLSYVQEQNADVMIENISAAYSDYREILTQENTGSTCGQTQIHLILGDTVLDILSEYADMDIAWLKDIRLDVYANATPEAGEYRLGIGLGEHIIASLEYIMSADGMWLRIPELSPLYLTGFVDMEGFTNSADTLEQIKAILPSPEDLQAVMKTYSAIVFENLNNVEKSQQTVELNGISQELTVLTAKITPEDVVNIAMLAVDHLMEDQSVRNMVEQWSAYENELRAELRAQALEILEEDQLEEIFGDELDPVDYYAQLQALLPQWKEQLRSAVSEEAATNYISLDFYVTNEDEIVGYQMTMTVEGQTMPMLYMMRLINGAESAELVEIATLKLNGTETVTDGKATGSYVLSVDGVDTFVLEWKDVVNDGNGNESGTYTFKPSKQILEEIIGENETVSGMLSAADPSLVFTYDSSATHASGLLEVKVLGNALLSLSFDNNLLTGQTVTIPTDALDVNGEGAQDQYMQSISLDTLLANLEKVGVPSYLLTIIRTLIGS